MKTKTLRLPVLFASAGALFWTVSVARAAESLEVRQESTTSQKEVINEPSGAERTYSTRIETGPAYGTSYGTQTYESNTSLDPDTEGDRIMHMYQRGRHAAESLDRQIKPNPIVVLPGATTFESSAAYPPNHLGELQQQQSYSSSFNEPAAAERESSTSSTTTRRYSTTESTPSSSEPAAMLSSGTTVKASDLIGMNIKNEQGEKIGEVKDVVVDLKSGRVAYTVVSAGGIAGIGDKWLAVPPTLFSRTGTEKNLTWNIDKEKLSTAPTIDKHNWNAAYQQDYIGNVYSFYGVESYEANEPAGSQKKDLQYHHDSEKQDRQEKQNRQDQDQSRNDASSSSASSESSRQSDLQKSEPEKSASADVSKEAAGAQPSTPTGAYSGGTQSSSSSGAKSSTDASSRSSTDTSSSSSLKSEPQSGALSTQAAATANEAAGAAVGSLPDKVQMALKNDASLSGSAQNVQFSMNESKLTVKGTVKSEDEKNRILEKVRAIAGETKVDDQLKVTASSDSNPSDNSSDNDK